MPKERIVPVCPYKRSNHKCILTETHDCSVTNDTLPDAQEILINMCARGAIAEYYAMRPSYPRSVDGPRYNFSISTPDGDIGPYDGI